MSLRNVNDSQSFMGELKAVTAPDRWRRKIITALIVGLALPIASPMVSNAAVVPGMSSTSFTHPENLQTVTALSVTSGVVESWSFQDGINNADEDYFTLSSGGVLSFITAPDYENPEDTNTAYNDADNNVYIVHVSAIVDLDGVDGGETQTISSPITVTVTDHNWTYTGTSTFTILESATAVGTVSGVSQAYTGPPSGSTPLSTETHTISGVDATYFNIQTATGVLSLKNPSDHETKASYSLQVVLTRGNDSMTVNVTVNVTDYDLVYVRFNDYPTSGDTSTSYSINETGTAAGQLVTGKNALDEVTYALFAGGTHNSLVTVSPSGSVSLNSASDYESQTAYNINVIATSGVTGETVTQALTIYIDNVGPTIGWDSTPGDSTAITIGEMTSFVDTLTNSTSPLVPPYDGTPVTYAFVTGPSAQPHNVYFQIQTRTVSFINRLMSDYESTTNVFTINVIATDANGETKVATLTINLENRGPDVVKWNYSNQTTTAINEWASFVDTITSTTIDGADLGTDGDSNPATFAWETPTAYSDNNLFDLESTTGRVTFKGSTVSDFEARESYTVSVVATDSLGETKTQTLTITVNDNGPTGIKFVSGVNAGSCSDTILVGTVETTNAYVCENYVGAIDSVTATTGASTWGSGPAPTNYTGAALTYSLLNGYDAKWFKIDTNTGVLSTNRNLKQSNLVGVLGDDLDVDYEVGLDHEFPLWADTLTYYYKVNVQVFDGKETRTEILDIYVDDDGQVYEFAPSSLSAVGGPGTITVNIGRPEGLLARHAAIAEAVYGDYDYYDENAYELYLLSQMIDQAQGWRYTVEYALETETIKWNSAGLFNVSDPLIETQTAVITGLPQGDYRIRVGYADLFGSLSEYGPFGYGLAYAEDQNSCALAAMYGDTPFYKNLTPSLYLGNYCYRVLGGDFFEFGPQTVTVQSAIPVKGDKGDRGPAPIIVFSPVTPGLPGTTPTADPIQIPGQETVTVALTIPVGAKGETGTAGAKGETGTAGAKGETGTAGAKGETGTAGANGTNGAPGLTGATGATGASGATGAAGATGATGAKGETGAAGTSGSAGAKGDKGDKGDTGPQGPQGATGPKGATSIFGVIAFNNASYTLTAKDKKAIQQAGIKKGATITVSGYTSKVGSTSLNERLSAQRAASIAKQIKALLPKITVRSVGYGEKVNKACTKLQNRCAVISVTQPANS